MKTGCFEPSGRHVLVARWQVPNVWARRATTTAVIGWSFSQGRKSMAYFALFYEVVDDFVARRAAFREEHLRLARDAHGRGEVVLAGALAEPADRALIVFHSKDKSVPEDFARKDPYVVSGLVKRWEVRPWNVVVGNQ
jgi:hypothetical protein